MVIKTVTAIVALLGIVSSLLTLSKTSRIRHGLEKDVALLEKTRDWAPVGKDSLQASIDKRTAHLLARIELPPQRVFIVSYMMINCAAIAWLMYSDRDEYPAASFLFTAIGIVLLDASLFLTEEARRTVQRCIFLARSKEYRKYSTQLAETAFKTQLASAATCAVFVPLYIYANRVVVFEGSAEKSLARDILAATLFAITLAILHWHYFRRIYAARTWRRRLKIAALKVRTGKTMSRTYEALLERLPVGCDEYLSLHLAAIDATQKLEKVVNYRHELKKNPFVKSPPGWSDWPFPPERRKGLRSWPRKERPEATDYADFRSRVAGDVEELLTRLGDTAPSDRATEPSHS